MKHALPWCVLAAAAFGCASPSPSQPTGAAASTTAANATPSIAAPRPSLPPNNSTVRFSDQPLTLTAFNAITTSGAAVTYTFEVASDANFTSRVQTWDNVAQGAAGAGVTTQRLDPLAAARDYWWHVRASGGGTTGVYGPAFKFTVGPQVTLGTPTPLAPLTGQLTPSRPTLRVSNVSRSGPTGPITYRFEIANSAAFTTIVATGTVAEGVNETGFTPASALTLDTVYFWRATAIDGQNSVTSAPSAAQSFTPHIVSQAETIAQQLGRPLWSGEVPSGSPGHATMGDFWGVEVLVSYTGVRFQNPPFDALQIFDLLDRGYAEQDALDWMNSHGYRTNAAWYPVPRVFGFDYEYMAYVGAQWSLVLRVGA